MAEEKKDEKEPQPQDDQEAPGIDLDRLYNKMDDDWTDRLDKALGARLEGKDKKPVAEPAASE